MHTKGLPIDEDIGIHVNTFKINGDAFTFPYRRNIEYLSVPSDACREVTTSTTRWIIRIYFPFDLQSCGKSRFLQLLSSKSLVLAVGASPKKEFPIVIEKLFALDVFLRLHAYCYAYEKYYCC